MMYWNEKTPLRAFASLIWCTSEYLNVPLGRFAPVVFGLMTGARGGKKLKKKPTEVK